MAKPTLDGELRQLLRQAISNSVRSRVRYTGNALTPSELKIIGLVADGLTSREIGERLGVSSSRVNTQIRSVRAKLGARNKSEAVAFARLEAESAPSRLTATPGGRDA
jgi:DNA-binding CsgD family transcriptional regulator